MWIKIPKSLLVIIFLSLFFRLILLNVIPSGLSFDEQDYILNAKALFLSGHDISGTWNPLSLTTPKSSFPQAEIAPLLTFWLIGILPLSLLTSKLIYALFGVGTVVVLYFIAKKLFGVKEAYVVGLIASINPWLLFFSRTAYDTPISILGYLLALYVLLVSKGWKILIAFPFLFIAFYSYIGSKLLYIPFISIAVAYSWLVINKKKFAKQYLVLVFLSVIPIIFYVFTLFHSGGSRISELSTPNMPSIAATTNRERKLAIANPLLPMFSNKFVVFAKYSIEKYANAFAPDFLFIHGDSKSLFTIWEHGVFYYLDALFLIIGGCFLFLKKKKELILIIGFIAVAPIPSIVSNVGTSYAIRSMLMAPCILLLIGCGIYYFISLINKKYKKWVVLFILVLYILQLLNYSEIYFFRNPIYNSESFNFSSRVLSKYLMLQKGRETYVINGDPTSPLKSYMFYSNSLNYDSAKSVATMYKTKKFEINNIHFLTCQQASQLGNESLIIYESGLKCPIISKNNHDLSITYLSDGGSIYTIQNDKICSKFQLKKYPYGLTLSDFEIEKLSTQKFCEKFIISN